MAVTSLAVGTVGMSASADESELAANDFLSVEANATTETVTADDGTIIPIDSTAVTVGIKGNNGFDSSTTKLDISTVNVIVNNEGDPIYTVGNVVVYFIR